MEPIWKIKDILEPLEDDEDEIKDFLLTGHLYDEFKKNLELLKGLIHTLIVGETGRVFDFLTWFESSIARGHDEHRWYWFDMLHYRYTGEFAKNLMLLATEEDDDDMRELLIAYTIGYMTHLATDIVGHPYVNRFSGGPYRTQWHRHFLGENVIDAWAWREYDPDIGEPDDDAPDNSLAFASIHESLKLNTNEKRRLASLIHEALGRTYGEVESPDIISQDQIRSLFDFMYEYFNHATKQSSLSIPEPQEPEIFPSLDDLFENPPNVPNPADDDMNWEDVFAGIVGFVSWAAETLVEAATLPFAAAADLTTFPLRWWLYEIKLLLYDLHKSARWMLVLEGYVLPHNDELHHAALGEFIHQRAYSPDYPRMRNAPVLHDANGDPRPIDPPEPPPPSNEHQLGYPGTGVEERSTISSPYDLDDTPRAFIDSVVDDLSEICPRLRQIAESVGPYAPRDPEPGIVYTDQATKDILQDGRHYPLGAAPDLGALFIQKAIRDQDLYDTLGLSKLDATDLSRLDGLDMGSMDFQSGCR